MEITFHSLFYILTIWLLISSTIGGIALQPDFDQSEQFRHLSSNIPPNPYQPIFPTHQAYQQPYYGQIGQMPYNYQSISSPSWPNPWMMAYRPYSQFGQPKLPGPSPSFPTAPNQFQPRGLDVELQRAKALQQKLSAHMNGFAQSNSAQLPQQALAPVYPNQNVPYYSFYLPYEQSPNNLRSYRSLPILQSRGYQIIKLQDLQNAQHQGSWLNPVDSRLDPGVNPQTYHSQRHEMATISSINSPQLELNAPEFNKKVDDDIVGSPLQIYKSQSLLHEQHHPVEMVNIPDDFYTSNNTSEVNEDNMDMMKKNPQNFSKMIDQMISNSSNTNGNLSQENSQQVEQEISYIEHNTNNPTKDILEEVKSQSIHQHSTHKDYTISSGAKGNDKSITNIQYPLFNGRINYNQPQVFAVGANPQNSYGPQMDLMNLQTSNTPAVSNYPSKTNYDAYKPYKNYPPMNVLSSPKFPFGAYNLDNSYNIATNAVSKEPALWPPPGLSNTGYVSNWNNFGNEYYQQ